MLKRSFSNIIKNPEKITENMPYIVALSFKELEQDENLIIKSYEPVFCKFCGSALVDFERLEQKGDKFEWICEFCLNKNEIDAKDLKIEKITKEGKTELKTDTNKKQQMEELSLLFKKITEKAEEDKYKDTKAKTKTAEEQGKNDSLIAVIDISGSMSGGKLESVKHSLLQNVKDLKYNAPLTIFVLITFTDDVEIYPNPSTKINIRKDEFLHKENNLEKELKRILKEITIGPIGEFADGWIRCIENLRTIGWTALGPGIFSAVVLAENKIIKEKKASSRIILLTDGLANQGFGVVEGKDPKKAKIFYEKLGQRCLESGIIIDLVGVAERSKVALDVIGVLTDITGGAMTFISSKEIESTFRYLQDKKYIAKDAVIRVYTGGLLEIAEISGTYVRDLPKKDGIPIKLGALDPSREIYIKFRQKKEINRDKVPIQIQMEYLDQNNQKSYRVIKSYVKVSSDPNEYKKNYYADLYANMELQKISTLGADTTTRKQKNMQLLTTLKSPDLKMAKNVNLAQELAEFELEEIEEEENLAKHQYDKRSYFAAASQMKSRMNQELRMLMMKKKKKK
ncbi:MAG: hypothetical protein ACTSRZ_10800 [Promethearchaeota archaeon]